MSECVRPFTGIPLHLEFVFNLLSAFREPLQVSDWRPNGGTKMMSAHSTSSGVTGFSASGLSPADEHSRSVRAENRCSAVGLRREFCLQMKRMRFMTLRTKGRDSLCFSIPTILPTELVDGLTDNLKEPHSESLDSCLYILLSTELTPIFIRIPSLRSSAAIRELCEEPPKPKVVPDQHFIR